MKFVRCVVVCCSVLQCVAVRCSALQCVYLSPCDLDNSSRWVHGMCCSALQCAAMCCSMLQYVAVYCSVISSINVLFKCVAVWCSVLQCVTVCCNALQYFAMFCSVTSRVDGLQCLQYHPIIYITYTYIYTDGLFRVLLLFQCNRSLRHLITLSPHPHCNTLQHTATHCNTLQLYK